MDEDEVAAWGAAVLLGFLSPSCFSSILVLSEAFASLDPVLARLAGGAF